MKNVYRVIHVLIFLLGLQIFVQAQSKQSELKSLSKKADIILTGKVVQKKSGWNNSKTRIYTTNTIEVEKYLKGSGTGKMIDIVTPGGEVDNVGELYTHVATFENDEEVMLFIKKDERNFNYKIIDGDDGKISLHTDKKTGEKFTVQNIKVSAYENAVIKYMHDNK